MPKKFEPNRRLLRTLVGSNLYGSPDACVRELIQNAWDAIQWRKKHGDGSGSRIEIRYCVNENWFEVIDDGFGMDQDAIEGSFFDVGQDKLEVLGEAERETQIGYFGIGVLSIFLIADKFKVTTRRADPAANGICFEVTDIDEMPNYFESKDESIGTCIRVYPRNSDEFSVASIPKAVKNYVRHVDEIYISSVDDNTEESLANTWDLKDLSNIKQFNDLPGIRAARFGFVSALQDPSGTLSSEFTICNAGFLTEADVHDLIPLPTLGIGGEIDLKPHTLTMGISRERVQRDTLWTQLGTYLQERFISLALDELLNGEFSCGNLLETVEMKRNLLLWYNFIPSSHPFSELYEVIDQRLYETVPFTLSDKSQTSLKGIFKSDARGSKLFFKQVYQPNERVQNIDDEGMPIRVSEEIRDSIRVGALRAKGFEVIELDRLQVNLRERGSVRTKWVDEYPLILKCLRKRGVQLINITDALDSDMDLQSIEKLPVLKDALQIVGGLRFASIQDSTRRIVTDHSGAKYINLRNENAQKLLKIIPQAVSNPLKNKLLEAYLKIEDFKLYQARQILIGLLEADDLDTLASIDIAPHTREYINSSIEKLLSELD